MMKPHRVPLTHDGDGAMQKVSSQETTLALPQHWYGTVVSKGQFVEALHRNPEWTARSTQC